jgi:hypothetical protein
MSFYESAGETFLSTEETRGPWSDLHQHGGPPAALMARALEKLAPAMFPSRITVELLRPIPIAPLAVTTRVLRAGKKVQIASASLLAGDQEVARAQLLSMRRLDIGEGAEPAIALPAPDACAPYAFTFFSSARGYHTAMELRSIRGTFGQGAFAAWFRMRIPLVAGETPSPLQRVLCAADSGNGISIALDVARFSVLNPDLTVALHRLPAGEWIAVDAITRISIEGVGTADSMLADACGPIGRGVQSLIVEPRSGTAR